MSQPPQDRPQGPPGSVRESDKAEPTMKLSRASGSGPPSPADRTLKEPTVVLDSIDDIVFVADGENGLSLRHGKTVSQVIEQLVSTSAEGTQACFIVMRGQQVGRMYQLGPGIAYLGRADDVTISIDDTSVSRRHAAVHSSPIGFVISDLKSTNGLFVNGERVERHVLRDGDRIQFGSSTVLKFCYQDELEQNLQQRLYESATRDQLVGVHNRQFFLDSLEATFAHATRKNLPLSLLMLDIDHFKNVNDTHGHLAGDHVLREIARIIKQAIRTEDVFARFGGEEFVLVLAESDPECARHAAERIRKAVEGQVFEYESRPIKSTLSIRLTTYHARNYPSPHSLIAAADAALYEAKRAGRNCTIWTEGPPRQAPAAEGPPTAR